MKFIEITKPGGSEVLTINSKEIPQIGADEVLISVKAAGVNRPDVLQREGKYPMPKGVTPIPGLEVAGIITAIGKNVTSFSVGDKVCALTNGGGYAEFYAVPYTQVLPIPSTISFVEAAAIPETFFTVWANLFDRGNASQKDTVLIHGGASGIGTTALTLCKALGINAISTVGSDDKVDALKAFGTIINYKKLDFENEILSITKGEGVDVILDIVGAPYFNRNLNILKKDGRLVIIGYMGGRVVENFDLQQLMLKRLIVTGTTMRSRTAEEKQLIANGLIANVWPLIEANLCKPLIYKVFPFENVKEAHQAIDKGDHIGKIVLSLEN